MRVLSRFSIVVLLLTTFSCDEPFDPAFLIKGPRVIALIAEPAEARPGESVTLTPVFVSPEGTLSADEYQAQWWRCPDNPRDPLQDDPLCEARARTNLGEQSVYTDTIAQNFFPSPEDEDDPSLFANNQALLGALLGYWRVIGTTLNSDDDEQDIDAFKRIVITPNTPLADLDPRLEDLDTRIGPRGRDSKNQNPTLTSVDVHEGSPTGDIVTELNAGATYFFVPRADDASLQAYFSLDIDLEGLDIAQPGLFESLGEVELLSRFSRTLRCEVPRYSWFVSGGALVSESTLDEEILERTFSDLACPKSENALRNAAVRFTAPSTEGPLRLWTVMRDGRGGTDVFSVELNVIP